MNTLQLRWQALAGKTRLEIGIDGQLLTTLVRQFELAQGYFPFGDTFLCTEEVDWCARPAWQRSADGHPARLVLLGCGCGDVDCSQLYAEVREHGGWVQWVMGGWPERDYRGLGPYWFELTAYRQAVLGALPAECPVGHPA
ncbi:MAG: hypothetical protein VW877_03735 [Pseudomonadaceae bacterium]